MANYIEPEKNKNDIQTSKLFQNGERHNKALTEGDIVKYTVTKRLSEDRAIVTIRGKQMLADISIDKPDKGVAEIISIDKQLRLLIKSEKKEIINNTPVNKNTSNNLTVMLNERGVKANEENINYLGKVLKYMPDINERNINIVYSYISNSVYPTIDELLSVFGGNIFKTIRNILIKKYLDKNSNLDISSGKKINEKQISVEKLMLLYNHFQNEDETYKLLFKTVVSNGHYAFWSLLFDILRQEEDESLYKSIKILLKYLSANRRSKFLKENVYFIPMYIDILGKERFIEFFLYDDKGRGGGQSGEKRMFDVNIYDEKNEKICEISIKKFESFYKIIVYLLNVELYNLCKESESRLKQNLDTAEDIKIEVELSCLKKT